MKLINETDTHHVYVTFISEEPVRVFSCKQSGEVSFVLDDLAKALGYESEEEMMSNDAILDEIIEIQKTSGCFPVKSMNIQSKVQADQI